MSTLDEFHPFYSLPFELRLKIWGMDLSTPREVNIICQVQGRFTTFKSSNRPPALLHVCRESREEALKIYRPFGTESSPVYVAPSQDIIIVSDQSLKYMRGVEGTQKMTVNIKHSSRFQHFSNSLTNIQASLRELELIFEEGEMYDDRGDGHMVPVRNIVLEEIQQVPHWNYPNINIVDGKTGKTWRIPERSSII
jgi:hypothetical protein